MIWPFRKSKTSKTPESDLNSATEMLEIASKVITSYDDYLQANPLVLGSYRDVSKLPFPKAAIIRAFQIELAFERDDTIREFLLSTGFTLAQFQEGVGSVDLVPTPFLPPSKSDALTDEEFLTQINNHQPIFERWKGFGAEFEREAASIGALFEKSVQFSLARKS